VHSRYSRAGNQRLHQSRRDYEPITKRFRPSRRTTTIASIRARGGKERSKERSFARSTILIIHQRSGESGVPLQLLELLLSELPEAELEESWKNIQATRRRTKMRSDATY